MFSLNECTLGGVLEEIKIHSLENNRKMAIIHILTSEYSHQNDAYGEPKIVARKFSVVSFNATHVELLSKATKGQKIIVRGVLRNKRIPAEKEGEEDSWKMEIQIGGKNSLLFLGEAPLNE